MINDLPFEVVALSDAYRCRAVRAALLTASWKGGERPERFVRDHGKLREKWRACVMRLHEGGYEKLMTRRACQYARNCPPVGVTTANKSRRCGMSHLCPFCWGRQYVFGPFCAMETALDGGGSLPLLARGKWLIETSRRAEPGDSLKAGGTEGRGVDTRRAIRFLVAGLCTIRQREQKSLDGALGGMVFHRFIHRKRALPSLVRSSLTLVPSNTSLEKLRARDDLTVVKVHEKITKQVLVGAFARACRYHEGWLTAAGPEELTAYLEALRRTKLLSVWGSMRGQRKG